MISADMGLAFLEEEGKKKASQKNVGRRRDVGEIESRDSQVRISIGVISVGSFAQRLGKALGAVIVVLTMKHLAGRLLQVDRRMPSGVKAAQRDRPVVGRIILH